jgi:hypothetical protein
MAWVAVPGSAGIWEYENTATGADTYSDANGTYAGGIRSYTPEGGGLQETYARTRKAIDATGRLHIEEITFTGSAKTATDLIIVTPQGSVTTTLAVADLPAIIAGKVVTSFTGNADWTASNVDGVLTLTAITPELLDGVITVNAGTTGVTSTQETTQNGYRITNTERGELSKNYYDARI